MISSYRRPKPIRNVNVNRNKVSIIEILAVLLIIVVGIIIINPIASRLKDEINKRKYITYVNTYIDKAVDMYGNDEYKSKFTKAGNVYTIAFADIEGVNITKDPYGFNYKLEDSYVVFNPKTKDIIVNAKSCVTSEGNEYCYEIADVDTKDLTPDSIKTSIN